MDILNSILNNIDDALIIMDPYGKILLYNQVAEDINKVLVKVPIGINKNLAQVISPDRSKVVSDLIKEVRTTGKSARKFAEYLTNEGTPIYLEFHYIPVSNDESEVSHIHLLARDITPQKAFEKKLVTQANNINQLIEKANAVIMGLDTRGYITDWNGHCIKITGFEKNEVYAKKFVNTLMDERRAGEFHKMMEMVLAGNPVENYELTIRTKRDRALTLLLSSTPRTSASGAVVGVSLVGQDVTELTEYRKSLEQQVEERTRALQQALKKEKEVVEMKSRFVSVASHEFRSPLSSIQHTATFIKNNNFRLKGDEIRVKLESIEKHIKHMTHLLDDVLTYGKAEANKIQLHLTELVLSEFLEKLVEEVGHNTKNSHIIQTVFSQLPSKIEMDEKLLRNILTNLLSNAIKYSPDQEHVDFSVQAADRYLIFTIHDTGIGVPEDELDKIFEPFVRGKYADKIQGTGLGLSIVKKAVELLKGTIEVRSELNKGTTFSVTIPYQQL
ncbi:MAG: PAS domain-containing sensor histidine kinase [Flammeovirgaceae bacterium]|nr:PAS domain-containing sensor histidine kinase [Flammeovirgaceae bacterium]